MKILLPILFSWFFCSSFGQNYNCFQPSQKKYFINGNNYVRGIRIDSIQAIGSDIIYYPYRTNRIANYWGTAIFDTLGSCWLGKNVIEHPNGTFVFNNLLDTVIIKTQAHIGDSWVFYTDTANLSYQATLTSEDTMTVLGALDSIKRITITADSAGLPHPADPVNNFQIILSKNYGFVQVFDLFTFPYLMPGVDYYQDIVLGNVGAYDLSGSGYNKPDTINSVFHLLPLYDPTLMEIYNFAVGDVFETSFTADAGLYQTYTLDSILSKTATTYNASYTGIEHIESTVTDISTTPVTRTTTYGTGVYTANGDTSRLLSYTLPEEWDGGYLLHYFPKQQLISPGCDTSDSYEIDVDYKGTGLVYTGVALLPSYAFSTYSMGYGMTSKINNEVLSSESLSLIYYYKHMLVADSSGCGNFADIIPERVPSISANSIITALPNPANNYVNITANKLFGANTTIKLCDVNGRCVFQSSIDGKSTVSINTSSVPGGLYMIIIQDNFGVIYKEKIVVTH
jgi:hypothetical protein